jgi:hypothetical protein
MLLLLLAVGISVRAVRVGKALLERERKEITHREVTEKNNVQCKGAQERGREWDWKTVHVHNIQDIET